MSEKELRAAIRQLRREMKEQGIRRTSLMNGGLTPAEYRCNAEMFRLETLLKDERRKYAATIPTPGA